MWAAQSVKAGYRWNLGKGDKVIFWEDIWFGQCSLAIVFWDLYVIANEHLDSVWNGVDLMISFKRTVSPTLYNRWLDLVNLMTTISLTELLENY
jgi:hypothetical protein